MKKNNDSNVLNVTTNDLEDVLYLKNQLICFSTEQLLNMYAKDDDMYLTFIDSVVVAMNVDSVFFFFDCSILDKISSVVQARRFNFCGNGNVVDVINFIIHFINEYNCMDETLKNLYKKQYLLYQEETRRINMNEHIIFPVSCSDAILFDALSNDNLDSIPNDYMFLSSLNFLLSYIPIIFKDEKIKKNVINKLQIIMSMDSSDRKIRNFARKTMNDFNNNIVKVKK